MKTPDSDPWQAASFAGARRAQVREAARRTTAYERIRWACDMSEAVRLRQQASEETVRLRQKASEEISHEAPGGHPKSKG